MRRTAWAWLPLALSSTLPNKATAQERSSGNVGATAEASVASGFAVAAGLGHSYGSLLGVQLSYGFAAPGSRVAAAPFAALGYFPSWEEAEGRSSATFGVMGYWGLRHRWVAEVAYGALSMRTLTLHQSVVAVKPAYGLSLCSGYEFLTEPGLFVRLLLGAGATLDVEPAMGTLLLSAGMGWKF